MVRQKKLYNRLHGGRLRSKIPFRRFYSVSDVSAAAAASRSGNGLNSTDTGQAVTSATLSRQSSCQQSLFNGNSSQPDPEHEAFLRAFQIPTTLYRFLAQRHDANPAFLHRNLNYMKVKHSTINKNEHSKSCPTLDGVVDRLSQANSTAPRRPNDSPVRCHKSQSSDHNFGNGVNNHSQPSASKHLGIKFAGFFDSELEKEWRTVYANLSIYALHRWKNHRKGLAGQSVYPVLSNHKLSCFQLADSRSQSPSKKTSPTSPIRLSTAKQSTSPRLGAKTLRRRYSSSSPCVELSLNELTRPIDLPGRLENTALLFVIDALEKRISQNFLLPDKRPRFARLTASNRKLDGYPVRYKAEVPLLFKDGKVGPLTCDEYRIDLVPGDYEIRLDVDWKESKRVVNEDGHINLAEWQPVHLSEDSPATQEYSKWPVLRFSVTINQSADSSNASSGSQCTTSSNQPDLHLDNPTGKSIRTLESSSPSKSSISYAPPPEGSSNEDGSNAPYSVSYRFFYNNHLHQWTESKDLVCPWCRLNCDRNPPHSLIYHLRACHPRFLIRSRLTDAAKKTLDLDVSINENFNTSNDCGMRRGCRDTKLVCANWHKDFVVGQPVHRLPYSQLIYWNKITGDRQSGSLSPVYHHLTVGHKRAYYHPLTALPIRPCEFDMNLESTELPPWIYSYYWRKIEDFTDLNKGEKLLMQLWNQHLLKYPLMGDFQMPSIVDSFIQSAGPQLKAAGTRGNLICHLATLTDFLVLTPQQLDHAITKFDQLPG